MAVTIENIDLELDEDQDEVMPPDNEKVAESKKEMGNHQYKIKQYSKALAYYTEAIDLCPENSSYYGNRSACYMMQGRYDLALSDAQQAVTLDPRFIKGWIRVAKCNLAIGDIVSTENAVAKVQELEGSTDSISSDVEKLKTFKMYSNEATKAFNLQDFRKVVFCLDRALQIAVACTKYKVLKAECLVLLGRVQEAQELVNDVLFKDKQNADAVYVRGMCLYQSNNLEKAITHFQHVLKLAPDHTKAMDCYKKAKALKQKKDEGNVAYNAKNFQEAYDLYNSALSIDPNNSKTNANLYFNRATALFKLAKLEEAIADCTLSLSLDPAYLKALLRRAKCYMDLEKYEEAVQDYKKAESMDKGVKPLLMEAELELKKSLRKDYYKILGVKKNASTEDIKKAYKQRALVYHPDRHVNATDNEKKEQEKRFKEVGEAYGVLSDPQQRMKYDNGQDIDDYRGGGMPGDHLFQSFFDADGGQFSERMFQNFFSGNPYTYTHEFSGGKFPFQNS